MMEKEKGTQKKTLDEGVSKTIWAHVCMTPISSSILTPRLSVVLTNFVNVTLGYVEYIHEICLNVKIQLLESYRQNIKNFHIT